MILTRHQRISFTKALYFVKIRFTGISQQAGVGNAFNFNPFDEI